MLYQTCTAAAALLLAFTSPGFSQSFDSLELHNVRRRNTPYRDREAVHLTPVAENGESLAVVKATDFLDGAIEADVAGAPTSGAGDFARGFIGIAFRVQADAAKFELIYLRPTNGRADDQLRRNHSTQYVSFPDWPWSRLRQETPGVYESYVDLETGAWTHMRIVVSGAKARLYINAAAQPCLIVNDLKLAPAKGSVALWVGPGTDGYFANLRVMR